MSDFVYILRNTCWFTSWSSAVGAILLLFNPYRKTSYGLLDVLLVSTVEFIISGFTAILVIVLRRETLASNGIQIKNLGRSLVVGLIFSLIIVAGQSLQAGALLWLLRGLYRIPWFFILESACVRLVAPQFRNDMVIMPLYGADFDK